MITKPSSFRYSRYAKIDINYRNGSVVKYSTAIEISILARRKRDDVHDLGTNIYLKVLRRGPTPLLGVPVSASGGAREPFNALHIVDGATTQLACAARGDGD